MAEELTELFALPCPECRMQGRDGNARIGNHRGNCTLCNRYSQAERRSLADALIKLYPEEALRLRAEIGLKLYPRYMTQFRRKYPRRRKGTT